MAAPAARAQYTVTSYSGGHWIDSGGASHDDGSPVTGAVFPGSCGVSVGIPAQTGGGTEAVHTGPQTLVIPPASSDTLSASGPITAHVHWSGSGPTPALVIEEEDCYVHWGGGVGTTGSCANPVGGTPQTLSPGQSCQYTKYTVLSSPSGDFDLTEEPTASVTVPHYVGGAIGVEYRVLFTVPYIGLSGVNTDDPNSPKALTGQKVTASVQGLPVLSVVTSYAWSVGGDTFKTYDYTAPNSTNATQLVLFSSTDLNGPQPSATSVSAVPDLPFYDRKAETLSPHCNVTFTTIDGNTVSVGVLCPKDLTMLKPSAVWHVNDNALVAAGLFYNSAVFGAQEVWDPITISVPAPFSGGSGCIAQIATFSRTATRTPLTGKPATYTVNEVTPSVRTTG